MTHELHSTLWEVLEQLRGEAGAIERVGRALDEREQRRVTALRAAAERVQQALDALAGLPASEAQLSGAGGAGADCVAGERAMPDEYGGQALELEQFGLAGDDDTEGYRRIRGGTSEA